MSDGLLGPDAARAWAERQSEDVPEPRPEKAGHYFTVDSLAAALLDNVPTTEREEYEKDGHHYIIHGGMWWPQDVIDALPAIINAAKEAERE